MVINKEVAAAILSDDTQHSLYEFLNHVKSSGSIEQAFLAMMENKIIVGSFDVNGMYLKQIFSHSNLTASSVEDDDAVASPGCAA